MGWVVNTTPWPLYPRGRPCFQYRRLVEPQVRSGLVQKISPPPGFDPRTVKPVASRYNDYAILALQSVVKRLFQRNGTVQSPIIHVRARSVVPHMFFYHLVCINMNDLKTRQMGGKKITRCFILYCPAVDLCNVLKCRIPTYIVALSRTCPSLYTHIISQFLCVYGSSSVHAMNLKVLKDISIG
jgi:hypothetical protein